VAKIKSQDRNVKSEFRLGHGLKTWFSRALGFLGTCSVGHHGLLPVIWDPTLADWRFGEYFESDSVSIHHGVFPLRTRARQAESTFELEQFVDQFT